MIETAGFLRAVYGVEPVQHEVRIIPTDINEALSVRRQIHAVVQATGHTERDAIAILTALNAAGWTLVEKGE